jgi:hypothetical protein
VARTRFDKFDWTYKMVSAGCIFIENLLAELEFTLQAKGVS